MAIFRNMQDLLRLIEIEGVDINPCGGTHLKCTSELQVLKIVGLEKSRGQARLRFMVGGRVLAALGSALKREVALNKVDLLHLMAVLAGLLSCLPLFLTLKATKALTNLCIGPQILDDCVIDLAAFDHTQAAMHQQSSQWAINAEHWVVCHCIAQLATAWALCLTEQNQDKVPWQCCIWLEAKLTHLRGLHFHCSSQMP